MLHITYFVHSITKDNEAGLATGWLAGELSAEGIKRAKQAAKGIAGKEFKAVFCSDLRRAVQSADLLFSNSLPLFLDWRLRECNYGEYDGMPAANFKKGRELDYIATPYPKGESYQDAQQRMHSFLVDACKLFHNKHIAVVGHQATQLALEVICNQKTWQQAFAEDWRTKGAWQLGWRYTFKE